MTLLETAVVRCDTYVMHAECNTANPPREFTPPPVAETVTTVLSSTGGDPMVTIWYLCAAALAIAAGAALIVWDLRRKQIKNQGR